MGQRKILEASGSTELSAAQSVAVRSHLQEVLSSDAFVGGHRAQHFLQLIVEHALAGELDSLRERMLGAEMFGRPVDYDTANDAVVRVKASEVRKRLARYYEGLASQPIVQIELPAGSYAPQFHWAPVQTPSTPAKPTNLLNSATTQSQPGNPDDPSAKYANRGNRRLWVIGGLLLAGFCAAFFSIGWFAAVRLSIRHRDLEVTHPLWAALFDGKRNTFIVPADVGLDLLEDLSHRPMALSDYMKGSYLQLPLPGVDPNSAQGLRSQRITSFSDAQIIASLTSLPEYNPQRTFLRFPRDLRLDDLKDSNGVLVGSVGSNPWAGIAGKSANFQIVYSQDRENATIINEHPQPGEQPVYESHWDNSAHETYAIIAFLPNMDGNGRLLLLQGLDVAGTQAAADMLFDSTAMAPILKRATRPDGSIHPFEILVRSTSINWNSTDSQVIASRIH